MFLFQHLAAEILDGHAGEVRSADGVAWIERAGEAAGLPFPVHVHIAAAFDGIRTGGQGNGYAAAQHFLGHASITDTVRYTAMSPEPFKDIWR